MGSTNLPLPDTTDIEKVRAFGRFYTGFLGALREGLLDSPFTLTEARTIYELAKRDAVATTTLSQELGLDPGYLSRVVKRLEKSSLVQKTVSPHDGRVRWLALTPEGEATFAKLDAASASQVAEALAPLSPKDREALVDAMGTIQKLLQPTPPEAVPFVLRPPHPGDLGWVVQRHGAVYAEEFHWGQRFEGLVAGIVAAFAEENDPRRERCWIAEVDGRNAGSVFLVEKSRTVAQLRLLLVERHARGLGIGRRLVSECTRFARQAGYTSIMLWTNSVLASARRIYEAEGYRLIREEPHDSFGHDLIGQHWTLEL